MTTVEALAVRVHPTANIADTARIGATGRRLREGLWERLGRPTTIGADCQVQDFCVIGDEAEIGEGSVLDCYSWVDVGATLGAGVMLLHRASVGARAWIGDRSIVGALLCERSRIGQDCRVFGDLIHRQLDPTRPWDAPESEEVAPTLEDRVFVGWGATIVGDVVVGSGAYVLSGATVTRDVQPGMIVSGLNEVCRPGDWRGPLSTSAFFSPG